MGRRLRHPLGQPGRRCLITSTRRTRRCRPTGPHHLTTPSNRGMEPRGTGPTHEAQAVNTHQTRNPLKQGIVRWIPASSFVTLASGAVQRATAFGSVTGILA
jgi:hypothetical protein